MAADSIQKLSVEATIGAIQNLAGPDDAIKTSYFHLSPCGGCGAPMWKQPCELCGFYPMGRPHQEYIDSCRIENVRDRFIRAVLSAGNIAFWYISGWKKTVAWHDNAEDFRGGLMEVAERARAVKCASPEDIYDVICGDRQTEEKT